MPVHAKTPAPVAAQSPLIGGPDSFDSGSGTLFDRYVDFGDRINCSEVRRLFWGARG